MLIVNGRSRASKVVDLVNLYQQWLNHIVPYELEPRVPKVVHHVLFPPREEIINDDYAVTSRDQTVHEMAADEPGSTGHKDPQPLTLQTQRDLPARM